jgi:carbamoyl-phosphate synthase large subunit
MLGKYLHELKNSVTGTTSAFYEPALDYIALKMPRWDLGKFKFSDHRIGSEMKSVGEVMALGRSFPEALQKAIRMLNIGAQGLTSHPYEFNNPIDEIRHATDGRIFAIYEALKLGKTVEQINKLSKINTWFLGHMSDIQKLEMIIQNSPLSKNLLLEAKQKGFADQVIANLKDQKVETVRRKRLRLGIKPVVKQIDTLAGEFDTPTNYLYTTYHGNTNDVTPIGSNSIVIIGSGPYSIGSSVEFDWCAVNTTKAFRAHDWQTIMINSNPETVSTDFDKSDRLYFEELTLERLRDIADFENPHGIVVSVGGQIANNLALPLYKHGYPILGTPPLQIDRAEDRQKFSTMLSKLGIDQPIWQEVTSFEKAQKFIAEIGYPVLIRPSYVLSGGAMNVVYNKKELAKYLIEAARLSPNHPVVISQFITNSKEIEIDGVAKEGKLQIYAISEHIENAGVHSGDASVVFPAQRLYLETVRKAKFITKQVIKNLKITGPFNIQFIAKANDLKVIECNVRASRSFPFVSKVSGHNFIAIATESLLGIDNKNTYQTLEYDYVAVKSPQFSYNRLKGADPVAGVEMASTGEVACFGDSLDEAFYNSWLATEQKVKLKSLFLSLPYEQHHKFTEEAAGLVKNGWKIYCTSGTHAYLKAHHVTTSVLSKIQEKTEPSVTSAIEKQQIGLMVNVPSFDSDTEDAYIIRRLAIDNHIPLVTNAESGKLLLRCLNDQQLINNEPKAWQDYVITNS